MKGKTI